jgi:hypothetical protein
VCVHCSVGSHLPYGAKTVLGCVESCQVGLPTHLQNETVAPDCSQVRYCLGSILLGLYLSGGVNRVGTEHDSSCEGGPASSLPVEPAFAIHELQVVVSLFIELLAEQARKWGGGRSHLQKTPAMVHAVLQVCCSAISPGLTPASARAGCVRVQVCCCYLPASNRRGCRLLCCSWSEHSTAPYSLRQGFPDYEEYILVSQAAVRHRSNEEKLPTPNPPKGGFTDVGIHTGGNPRDTCWALIRVTIQVCSVSSSCGGTAVSKYIRDGLQKPAHTQSGVAMHTCGYARRGFGSMCARGRVPDAARAGNVTPGRCALY